MGEEISLATQEDPVEYLRGARRSAIERIRDDALIFGFFDRLALQQLGAIASSA